MTESFAESAVVVAGPDGRICYWSDGASELFGYTTAEAIGATLDLIVPEEFRERHWAGFRRVMETGECRISGATMNIPVQTRDRGVLAFPGRLVALVDARGNGAGAAAIWAARRGDEAPFTPVEPR